MKKVILLLFVAAALYGAVKLWHAGVLELPGPQTQKRTKPPVVFEDVRIRVYNETSEVQADIFADKVLTDKKVNNLTFEPVRAVFYQQGQETATLTARQGKKQVKARKERVDFNGDVRVISNRPAELRTEKLRYFPKEGVLETPVRAWIVTTSTTVVGDTIRTKTNLKRGVLRGNVEIITNEGFDKSTSAGSSLTGPSTIRIRGDEAPFNSDSGIFRVIGNARAVKGRFVLTAHEIEYYQREARIVAKGRAQVSDPSFILNCNVLTYDLTTEIGVAEGLPKVTRTEIPESGNGGMVFTELRGKIIRFRGNRASQKSVKPIRRTSPKGKAEVEARDNVSLVRYQVTNHGMKENFRITCKAMDAWYAQRRTVFTGQFRLSSPKNQVRANLATYYETSNRFYVQGDAKAWELGPNGEKKNLIQGDMIVHDANRGTSKVLGSIRGSFQDDE